jgi:hypothetical protein
MTIRAFRGRGGSHPVAFLGAAAMVSLLVGCGGGDSAEETDVVIDETPSASAPAMAAATIVEPANGAEVDPGPVRVRLSAQNVTIVPAGTAQPNSGHHHLLLNVPAPAEGQAIPAGQEGVVHLGQGQTEYVFENMRPGQYTLLAVIGDATHLVLPQVIDTVQFTVLTPGE